MRKKRRERKKTSELKLRLEKTVNLASLQVNIDVEVTGRGGETGNGLDVRSQSVP